MAVRNTSPATIKQEEDDSKLTIIIPAAGMGSA